jgi:hypothetical protein
VLAQARFAGAQLMKLYKGNSAKGCISQGDSGGRIRGRAECVQADPVAGAVESSGLLNARWIADIGPNRAAAQYVHALEISAGPVKMFAATHCTRMVHKAVYMGSPRGR